MLALLERSAVRVDDDAREVALWDVRPLDEEARRGFHDLVADGVERGGLHLDEDLALGGLRHGGVFVEAEDLGGHAPAGDAPCLLYLWDRHGG